MSDNVKGGNIAPTDKERFEMSIPPLNYIELLHEWEHFREAHNGFDCYLAHTLVSERINHITEKSLKHSENQQLKELLKSACGIMKDFNNVAKELYPVTEITGTVFDTFLNQNKLKEILSKEMGE